MQRRDGLSSASCTPRTFDYCSPLAILDLRTSLFQQTHLRYLPADFTVSVTADDATPTLTSSARLSASCYSSLQGGPKNQTVY